MDSSSYLIDLDRLTYDPNDEVKMTTTAYNTLVRNIKTINQNILKNSEALSSIRRKNDVNEELAIEMDSIISSLKPKKKSKFGTKENLIPIIKFISTQEKYEEVIKSSPRTPLTPVPDYQDIMSKIESNIP